MRATAGGDGDSGGAEPQAAVMGRLVLIEREVLMYLAEQGQLDVDAFNLLIPRMVMWIVSLVCLRFFSLFSAFFFVFCCCFRGYINISMAFDFFFVFCFSWGCSYSLKMKHNRSFACCFYLEF